MVIKHGLVGLGKRMEKRMERSVAGERAVQLPTAMGETRMGLRQRRVLVAFWVARVL